MGDPALGEALVTLESAIPPEMSRSFLESLAMKVAERE
jgi:hypothetical protein